MKVSIRGSLVLIFIIFLLPCEVFAQMVKVPHYKVDTIVGYYELEYSTADSLRDGIVKAIYPGTDVIGLEKPYRNGMVNGMMKTRHPNGRLHVNAFYSNGKLNGVWEEWDEDGNLIIKCYYRDGVRHGRWSHLPAMHRGKYKDGKKHGRWKVRVNENRKIRRYKKGKLKYERSGFWFR